jgi:hypothetical protein
MPPEDLLIPAAQTVVAWKRIFDRVTQSPHTRWHGATASLTFRVGWQISSGQQADAPYFIRLLRAPPTATPPSTDINSRLPTSVAIWTSPIVDHGRRDTKAHVRRRFFTALGHRNLKCNLMVSTVCQPTSESRKEPMT